MIYFRIDWNFDHIVTSEEAGFSNPHEAIAAFARLSSILSQRR